VQVSSNNSTVNRFWNLRKGPHNSLRLHTTTGVARIIECTPAAKILYTPMHTTPWWPGFCRVPR